MNFPLYPHSVILTLEQSDFIWDGDGLACQWLGERQGGPLLITATNSTGDVPFEKPLVMLSDTSAVGYFSVREQLFDEGGHFIASDGGCFVELDHIRWNFYNKDTALLFKLTWGGAA